MFKKKPTIKPFAPLRSSDRRKIADQIIQEYGITVPTNPPLPENVEPTDANPDPAQSTTSNLSTIRNALLPDNSLSARFTTTSGPDLRQVHGTIYVGTHPGGEERILWFRLEQGPGADGRLYPTVYTLWHNPRLIPLLHTPSFVIQKLHGGADLMTPGLANGPPFPEAAVKGAVVAVASLQNPTVPSFVGICEIDIAGLGEVQGAKGHAVKGLHWAGDEVWAWSSSSRPGQTPPEFIEGWNAEIDEEDVKEIEERVDNLAVEETNGPDLDQEADGGVSLGAEAEEEPKEPTTKEIDDAFHKAFVYSLYQLKKDNPSLPNHGLQFPIQASALISNMITPYLPIYQPLQAQFYQIKKTSWKNVKKFTKYLDKQKLVKSKDRNGGETVILDVDFNDPELLQFQPYKLPSKTASDGAGKSKPSGNTSGAAAGGDSSVGQAFTIKVLYRPSGKLVPALFPPMGNNDPKNYYPQSAVSAQLNDYLAAQDPPIISPKNARVITLDPFLCNTVFARNSAEDNATLARGTANRDVILRRLLEDPALCAPYHAILKPGQTLADVKPKAGAVPKVTLTLEKRTGNKTVTRIVGVESFGIAPQTLAEELQKKCASSTSVAQAHGATKGVMEILVQGDQRGSVEGALGKRGVKEQWIEVVDKTRKKKAGPGR